MVGDCIPRDLQLSSYLARMNSNGLHVIDRSWDVKFINKVFTWCGRKGGKPIGQIHEDEILFASSAKYLAPTAGYEFVVCALKSYSDDKELPYRLVTILVSQLPEEIRQRHFLAEPPHHLAQDGTRIID